MQLPGDRGTTIQEFYRGANILITGGTGFMGKVLVEKLLRSCPHLSNIYLLVRSKKGKDVEVRIKELFEDPVSGTGCSTLLETVSNDPKPRVFLKYTEPF
jgi:FlaA1/EpsC-like NDP-sugar epimerase